MLRYGFLTIKGRIGGLRDEASVMLARSVTSMTPNALIVSRDMEQQERNNDATLVDLGTKELC